MDKINLIFFINNCILDCKNNYFFAKKLLFSKEFCYLPIFFIKKEQFVRKTEYLCTKFRLFSGKASLLILR